MFSLAGLTARLRAWFDAFLGAIKSARSQADLLIAATAQIHALTIVTRQVRDLGGHGAGVVKPFVA